MTVEDTDTPTTPVPTPVTLSRRESLSPAQRALLASQRRHPRSPLQNMAWLTHLDGEIDADRLAAAFARVVAGNDALRTRVVDSVDTDGNAEVEIDDAPARTEIVSVQRAEAVVWAEERTATPLQMSQRSYDSAVLQHEDGTSSWYLNLHHCVTDATSSMLVFSHTASEYAGEPVDGTSFYRWARTLGDRPGDDRALSHWRERPAAPRIGGLADAASPGTGASTRVEIDTAAMETELHEALNGPFRSFSSDTSWTTLLLTATAAYLHRVSGADSFALGLPVHNRSRPDARTIIGPLVEVFPVDVTVEPDDTVSSLARRIGRSLRSTLRHAEPGTAPAGTDIEAVVNVIPESDLASFAGVRATVRWIHAGASDPNHLIRVQLDRVGGSRLVLDLNDAATRGQHDQSAAHFASVLRHVAEGTDAPVAELPVLTERETAALDAWGAGPPAREVSHLVDQLEAALADRDTVALVDGAREWTGRQLWAAVVAGAETLRRDGLVHGERVAVEMGRSAELVVTIMSVLTAGGSYVPIDPDQPVERRDRLVARAGCRRRLTDSLHPLSLPPPDISPPTGAAPTPAPRSLDAEAYLLFTSGSTGEPKGVPITHLGLAHYLDFATSSYRGSEPPVVAFFSAITFDLTVTSLFLPFLTGGRQVVMRGTGAEAILEVASNPTITWCKATPSHLELLERHLGDTSRLAVLVVGGEAFPTSLARRLRARLPGVRIFNEYGPTEAVVGCMIHEWTPEHHADSPDVPIGRPAPGVRLEVLNGHRRRVPLGAAGELWIARPGLTAGYLGGDVEPFVQRDGRRWYRSGDLVRMLDDTTLVYLRRIDDQLKVGGIRLDPSEIEAALDEHPAVRRAAVRSWAPAIAPPAASCVRCGLADNVPGVEYDANGVCDRCRSYDEIRDTTRSWFKTPEDLIEVRDQARRTRTGDHDCVALLSGGKDSTYALFQLVRYGFDVFALTLDNGYISDSAKENVRRSVEALGIDHRFVTPDSMAAIFRDSLARHSNVCHGCFKTVYTVGTNAAVELGAPLVVTGLSRGQLFETRLLPAQFDPDRFDPDAIDEAVLAARRAYHRTDDAVRRLLDTSVFDDDELFERIQYVDFYRYVDVPLAEMLRFLDEEAPWVRPADTGRSTNCLINAAGISTHLHEQGFHNYAEPYAWDVRLGHKQRDEALAELDDRDDPADIARMLTEVGYTPRRRQTLTAWFETTPDLPVPTPTELRAHLARLLPSHAIPTAFVHVDQLPTTANGKLDNDALPAPQRVSRSSPTVVIEPTTPLERLIVDVWSDVLGLDAVSVDDDFFALGGDSLGALESAMALAERLDVDLPDAIVFSNRTPRLLADALDEQLGAGRPGAAHGAPSPADDGAPPEITRGEAALLFEHRSQRHDPRYNQGRRYRTTSELDPDRFRAAVEAVVDAQPSLHWTYGEPRRRLGTDDALDFAAATAQSDAEVDAITHDVHRRPFDLERGPLVRCRLITVAGATTVVIATHHVATDAASYDVIWRAIDAAYHGRAPTPPDISVADLARWQGRRAEDDADFWRAAHRPSSQLMLHPAGAATDGVARRRATIDPDELSRQGGARFATVIAALAAAVRPAQSGDAVAIGALVSTRDHRSADATVGYLQNTLPLVIDAARGQDIASLVHAVAGQLEVALNHRAYPVGSIVADRRAAGLDLPRLDLLVALQDLDDTSFGGTPIEPEVLDTGSSVAELTFFVQRHADRLDLVVERRGQLVDDTMAHRLLAAFDRALTNAVRAPQTTLDALHSSETPSVVRGADAPEPVHVLDRIRRHVVQRPSETAVTCGGHSLTWSELWQRSATVTSRLLEHGVRPGDRVIVALPRSTALLVAIVGVMRARCAYVPIDPTYPPGRNLAIVAAADAVAAVVPPPEATPSVPGSLQTELERHPVIEVEPVPSATATSTTTAEPADGWPEVLLSDPAYVIYTSGSTGTPRGVEIGHDALARSTAARSSEYADQPGRFLVVSSVAFDSSVAGLFWTLDTGGTIILPTDQEVHDLDALTSLFDRYEVSHTLVVPSLYRGMLRRALPDVHWPRQVIVAGEPCGSDVVGLHHRVRPESRLSNEYGPTEATVWATVAHLDPDRPVTIGHPIAGVWVAVVDADLEPVPVGVIGELVIGGPTVAAGYREHPGQPSEHDAKFVVSSLGDGSVFRTGDLAAVTDDGIFFHGRLDDQLNLGGVRIERAEVEAALRSGRGVTGAVVVAADVRPLAERIAQADRVRLADAFRGAAERSDPADALLAALDEPRNHVIVALVEGDTIDADDVHRRCVEMLPAASRPNVIRRCDELPRLPNGKVDVSAAGGLARTAAPLEVAVVDVARPGSAIEEVRTMVSDALDRPIGLDDDFFDAGGDSLRALELFLRIEARFGIRPPISILFEARTPRRLAALIDAETVDALGAPGQVITMRPGDESTTPLWIWPGADGALLTLAELANRIRAGTPVLGVEYPGTRGERAPVGSLTELADVCLRAVLDAQPDGPYRMVGYSLGGLVAVEVAQRLRATGRDVEFIGAIESGLAGVADPRGRAAKFAESWRDEGPARATRRIARTLGTLSRETVRRLRDRLENEAIDRFELRPSDRLLFSRMQDRLTAAGLDYQPPRLDVDILVCLGDDSTPRWRAAMEREWATVAGAELEVRIVDGSHADNSMLLEPSVASLSDAINERLGND